MKVVITGASKGIGAAIAKKYLAKKAQVFNIDIVNSKKVKTFVADITNAEKLKQIAKKIGKIDILICNAGEQTIAPLKSTSPKDFARITNVNLNGTFNTIHAFMNNINDHGHILNITSIHGELPRLEKFAYDASKAGINLLTKEVALALAKRNIHVNALALGATNTPMNAKLMKDKAKLNKVISKIPFNRIAEPDEVADVVITLLSKTFNYMSGSIVTFDGGRSLN